MLARAYGFAGWSRLREHLAVLDIWGREMAVTAEDDGPVDAFLRLSCLSYTEPYVAGRAVELLRADPALATANAATLATCGEADGLRSLLDRDPAAVGRAAGPHRWPPLLYLCYARLGLGDAVATARVLLDAGADPNAGFLWQWLPSAFTALTGVLGGGERDEPPHPDAVALATLLLDAGADPNDNQALYNRQFRSDDSHLGPLLEHGVGRPHPSPWRDRLGSAYPSPAEMLGEHLRTAAAAGFIERVRRLLAYGVDPNTRGYHPSLGDQTAYEVAVRHGHLGTAELLAAAGGRADRLDQVDLLLAAALAGDPATMQQLELPRAGAGSEPTRGSPPGRRTARRRGGRAAAGAGLQCQCHRAGSAQRSARGRAARGRAALRLAAGPGCGPDLPGPGLRRHTGRLGRPRRSQRPGRAAPIRRWLRQPEENLPRFGAGPPRARGARAT